MGKLTYGMVHCVRTKPSFRLTPQHIIDWHTKPKTEGGRGWSRPGYTDLILRDGTLQNLMPFDQDNEIDYNEMTWGAAGLNGVTRHIALEGGLAEDGSDANPLEQFPAMYPSLRLYIKYTTLRHPEIIWTGHSYHDDKKPFCPGYPPAEVYKQMGLSPENIYNYGRILT